MLSSDNLPVSLTRLAMKDYTFADGTFIPRGTVVGVSTRTIHYNDRVYENPHAFEPLRFADKDGAKDRFVSTGLDHLSFGHGKHAWYAVLFLLRLSLS